MKITEGQLDFLGLLNEYKDEQGATVRIREPKSQRLKPVSSAEPEQLRINFDEIKPAPVEEEKPKPIEKPKPVIADKSEPKAVLFKQCKKCWCFDCRHNSRNEGVPREMCGAMIPCPACDGCVSEDNATICEIGNAKEGCRLRAVEEGIVIESEPDDF